MFRKFLIQDSICIPQASKNHLIDSGHALNNKYINKIIPDCGISIKILTIDRIIETEAFEDCFLTKLNFEILIFQPMEGEILECIINRQQETGISCEHPILSEIFVNKFFPHTERKNFTPNNSMENGVFWCWNYKQNKFIFRNNQKMRCKISKISYKPFLIEARIDETGLGPVEWW